MSGAEILPSDSVSIVIPTYNRLELTQRCLSALAATRGEAVVEIVVVDNGSDEETVRFLAREAESGRIRLVRNDENAGFARACNQGAAAARGRFLFFLNNDTEVQTGWLAPLLRTLTLDAEVAAVGPKLVYPNGTIQHAGVVLVEVERKDGVILEGRHRGQGRPADWAAVDVPQTFRALTAAALLVRREAFEEVGGFDEGYWNGNEDVDLCLKLATRGWLLVYRPESVIVHAESQSGPERWSRCQENVARLTERWRGRVAADVRIDATGEARAEAGHGIRSYVEPRLVDRCERKAGTATVVVLTHNALDYTRRCVDSLLRHTDPRHELLFVDNASTDGTRDYLRELATREERCRFLANDENLGFAAGNNVGIAAARGEHVVLANNDIVVTPGWLERLLAVLDREPDAGLVGPVTNNISGVQQLASVPYDEESLDGLDAFAARLAVDEARRVEPTVRLVGFCLLIRQALLRRIGGLDEVFGRGNFEDNDYCLRALMAGYRSLVARDCFVHHFGSRSFAAAGIDYRRQITRQWEVFKRKWNIDPAVGYNEPFDAAGALGHGFHPALHFCPLSPEGYWSALPPPARARERWLLAGERLYAAQRWQDAERIFRAVLEYDSENIRAANNLAVTLWQRGERTEAVARLERLVARCPDAEDAAWNLKEFRASMEDECAVARREPSSAT